MTNQVQGRRVGSVEMTLKMLCKAYLKNIYRIFFLPKNNNNKTERVLFTENAYYADAVLQIKHTL